jgi:hypothetical protein
VHVVRRELSLAQAWLRQEMTGEDSAPKLASRALKSMCVSAA